MSQQKSGNSSWLKNTAFKDFDLNAAFHYSQPDALLHKHKWAANEAKQLYVSLQGAMLGHLKIALIVNAGLAELGIVAPPPAKIKESIRGTFPYANNMETILEEDKELEDNQQSPATGPFHKTDSNFDNESEPEHDEEELATLLKAQENDVSKSESEEGEYQETNRNESNTLDHLTKKLDFVVRKITSTSAWRGTSSLRAVIDEILKEDLEKVHAQRARQKGQGSQKELGHIQEIMILSHEWQLIKELNDELKVR
ncbi:hypothetical protein PCASD_06206 [Puccinia coronata f. sp. avenae]|uniref:Uncharacterized protein n=1 Tax=Puccinia coronata f. sp. avenae TaxID=200324 RepID=A0A2N5TGI5_9BASI|nr:hypothetical protein PCASD_06206 [Puccinia coronata f. sp. avenae]